MTVLEVLHKLILEPIEQFFDAIFFAGAGVHRESGAFDCYFEPGDQSATILNSLLSPSALIRIP